MQQRERQQRAEQPERQRAREQPAAVALVVPEHVHGVLIARRPRCDLQRPRAEMVG